MVITINSSFWWSWVIVDLTEGDAVFLGTIQATSWGGMAHVDYIALLLMDLEVEQLCWDCTKLPWKNLDEQVEAEETSAF